MVMMKKVWSNIVEFECDVVYEWREMTALGRCTLLPLWIIGAHACIPLILIAMFLDFALTIIITSTEKIEPYWTPTKQYIKGWFFKNGGGIL